MDPLITSLQDYCRAIQRLWTHPNFELEPGYDYFPRKKSLSTIGTSESLVLRRTGRLVRGSVGVELKQEEVKDDELSSFVDRTKTPLFGIQLFSDDRLKEVREDVETSLKSVISELRKIPHLCERIVESRGYKHFEKEDIQAARKDDDLFERAILTDFLTCALRTTKFDVQKWREFQDYDRLPGIIAQKFSDLVSRTHNEYRVVVFLNGPLIDSDEIRLGEITLNGYTISPRLAYVDDTLLTQLCNSIIRNDSIYDINSCISFDVNIPVDASVMDYQKLYEVAGKAAEIIVDCLRLVRSDDWGVLALEIFPRREWTPSIRKTLETRYQPELALYLPKRFAFQLSSIEPLTDEEVETLKKLLAKTPHACAVKGYQVALERFRDFHERYVPTEPRRLLDIAIAMEAIFLNDGDNKELKYRLSIRTARLLERDLERRRLVFNSSRDLYEFRSRVAHGDTLGDFKRSEQHRLKDVLTTAPDNLRRSLVYFCLDPEGKRPEETDPKIWWQNIELV